MSEQEQMKLDMVKNLALLLILNFNLFCNDNARLWIFARSATLPTSLS